MSELDDLLGRDRKNRDAQAERGALDRDHGPGWRESTVHPAIANLVADFITRIPPTAGEDAYWVSRLAQPTVHLPPEPVPLFSGWTREWKARLRQRAQCMRRDSRGPSRLLTIAVDQNDAAPKAFSLIHLDGRWSPATPLRGLGYWDSQYDFDLEDAKRAMVQYLR